jgi:hypothetical protein
VLGRTDEALAVAAGTMPSRRVLVAMLTGALTFVVVALAHGAATTPAAPLAFSGQTSQGSAIHFSYDRSAHRISDINTLVKARCAHGQRTSFAYGGFSLRVRSDHTFSTIGNAHGYFRGRFSSSKSARGRFVIDLGAGEPLDCRSGVVTFTARAATRAGQ